MKLKFRANTTLRGLLFHRPVAETVFSVGFANGDCLELRPDSPNSEPQNRSQKSIFASIYFSLEVSENAFQFVDCAAKGRYFKCEAGQPDAPLLVNGVERIDPNGLIRGTRPPYVAYPEELNQIAIQARDKATSLLQRFVGLICWRQGLNAAPLEVGLLAIYWATGPNGWLISERITHQAFPRKSSMRWKDGARDEINALCDIGQSREPLGHELLREAIGIAQSSPRSSVLMAVAALETGTKLHLSLIDPAGKWVENRRGPPLHKLLSEEIIKAHSRVGNDAKFWAEMNPEIEDARIFIKYRNTIAHARPLPDLEKPLRRYYQSISDILYALDVLEGHEWAKGQPHFNVRIRLKWPGWDKPHMELGDFVIFDPS